MEQNRFDELSGLNTPLSEEEIFNISNVKKYGDVLIGEAPAFMAPSPVDTFPLTEAGNGLRIARFAADRLRYDSSAGWRAWNGMYWVVDNGDKAMNIARNVICSIPNNIHQDNPDDVAKALSWTKASLKTSALKAALEQARTYPDMTLEPDRWDSDPWLLNVQNGTIDLTNGELRAPVQYNYITKMSPCSYRPGAKHQVVDRFLRTAIPDPAVRSYVQQVIGSALTGANHRKLLLLIYGPKDTGKTSFGEAILSILGSYATTCEPEILATKGQKRDAEAASPAMAALAGVRFVLSSELPDGMRIDSALIKKLTGGDRVKARFLYRDLFTFTPQFLPVILSNFKPVVSDSDDALWERMRVIPFENVLQEKDKDPQVSQILKSDPDALSALLAWAVDGCIAWHQNGQKLETPQTIKSATDQYQKEMDTLAHFIEECCDLGPMYSVRARPLKDRYISWARENDHHFSLSPPAFKKRLMAKGVHQKRENDAIKWFGIRLKNDEAH